MSLFMQDNGRGALISDCGLYRYRLWRIWNSDAPLMLWVMLNPSTADAGQDDPTLRKCIGFAKRHGRGGVLLLNLFAYRSTDPAALRAVPDPIGPENDEHILQACEDPRVGTIVAGWGAEPIVGFRAAAVSALLHGQGRQVWCFGRSANGSPRHPLMLAYATPLEAL